MQCNLMLCCADAIVKVISWFFLSDQNCKQNLSASRISIESKQTGNNLLSTVHTNITNTNLTLSCSLNYEDSKTALFHEQAAWSTTQYLQQYAYSVFIRGGNILCFTYMRASLPDKEHSSIGRWSDATWWRFRVNGRVRCNFYVGRHLDFFTFLQ